jgi:hypothetical protein
MVLFIRDKKKENIAFGGYRNTPKVPQRHSAAFPGNVSKDVPGINLKNRWLYLLLSLVIFCDNVNGKYLCVYNMGTTTGVGGSNMTIRHISGAEEMYDKTDFPWSNALPNPEDRWLKIYSDPYGVELDGDSRPVNSTTPIHLKLSVVKNPVTSPNKLKFYITDYTNFTWKNIIAEQYGLGDVNEPNDIKASYDVKQSVGQSIWLNELVNQYPDVVYDNWMIRFYNHADLNRDQKVDFKDYAIWAMNYGRTNTMPRDNTNDLGAYADIDRSGTVDCNDLSLFSGEWLYNADNPNTW